MRKTLIAVAAVAALGVNSTAMARHGGGGGGGAVHSMGGGGWGGGGGGVRSMGVHSMGVHSMGGRGFGATMGGPRTMGHIGRTGAVGTWSGSNWTGHHHHHHFNRFGRNAAFIGVGFGLGTGFGYYDSCWRLVPTYWGGWTRVWVCGYPYWGY